MSAEATERPVRRAALLLGASLFCTLSMGCQPVMSTSAAGTPRTIQNEWPLKFERHGFEAICYNTYGCKVNYAGRMQRDDDPDELAPAPPGGDYRERWGFASQIAIDNFPSPARVSWKSLDGSALTAEVDIGEIFRNEEILHNVAQADLPVETKATVGGPSIFLEVNDRTIRVFMSALIFKRSTRDGGNDSQHDLIEAWSKTY